MQQAAAQAQVNLNPLQPLLCFGDFVMLLALAHFILHGLKGFIFLGLLSFILYAFVKSSQPQGSASKTRPVQGYRRIIPVSR